MRNCDNCNHGSYGLDCNLGIERLFCREADYEYEVNPNDICGFHQYIDGMESEKNFVLYDESYFGEGYFIIHTENGSITKFFKIYTINDHGFPNFGIRAFSIDGKDEPDTEFTRIEFSFRSTEDFDNRLFNVFSQFGNNVRSKISTIDYCQQGRNGIVVSSKKDIVYIVFSKDVYKGKQHPTDYIDINLGDSYTCQYYEAINSLYNDLGAICSQTATLEDINELIRLRVQ